MSFPSETRIILDLMRPNKSGKLPLGNWGVSVVFPIEHIGESPVELYRFHGKKKALKCVKGLAALFHNAVLEEKP